MSHQLKSDFQLAQLRETNYRWYIEYHCPERKRPTFGLNRILNLEQRRRRGYELCELINWWMLAGLDIGRFTETEARRRKAEATRSTIAPRGHTDVRRAILFAVELKAALLKNPDSNRSYESHSRIFIQFLEQEGWELMPVDEIRHHHVVAFLDHRAITDKVRNSTINNNITSLNSLFAALIDRGFVVNNPCDKIKKRPNEPKLRRIFTVEEARVVIPYLYENDKLLCLAVLMMYCCYIRPKAIRQTRRGYIDLKRGLIKYSPSGTKTGSKIGAVTKTIPLSFLPYFEELVPAIHQNDYIFGTGFIAGGKAHCNKNRMYKRHKTLLTNMKKAGLLDNITGLTLYSWKDTGMTEDLEYLPLIGVQEQADHVSPDMTIKYRSKPEVNAHLLQKRNTVLPLK